MATIYCGVSAFFANRTGMHNWLDNNARPFISLITTKKSGKKSYNDLFINKDVKVSVNKAGNVTITFPKDLNKPLFSVLNKD